MYVATIQPDDDETLDAKSSATTKTKKSQYNKRDFLFSLAYYSPFRTMGQRMGNHYTKGIGSPLCYENSAKGVAHRKHCSTSFIIPDCFTPGSHCFPVFAKLPLDDSARRAGKTCSSSWQSTAKPLSDDHPWKAGGLQPRRHDNT